MALSAFRHGGRNTWSGEGLGPVTWGDVSALLVTAITTVTFGALGKMAGLEIAKQEYAPQLGTVCALVGMVVGFLLIRGPVARRIAGRH